MKEQMDQQEEEKQVQELEMEVEAKAAKNSAVNLDNLEAQIEEEEKQASIALAANARGQCPKFSDILYDERFLSSIPKKTSLEEIIYAMCGVEPPSKITPALVGLGEDLTHTTNTMNQQPQQEASPASANMLNTQSNTKP